MYFKTLRQVLFQPFYLGLFLVVSFLVLSIAILLPSFGLLQILWQSSSVSLLEIGSVVISLYGSLVTNFTVFSASYMVAISLLFGLQIALFTYYVKQLRSQTTNLTGVGASSVGGLVSGFFGIGCATCGTLLLTPFLALVGAAALLTWLPFGGEEFGLLGVALLLYANHIIVKKINAPLVCQT